MAHLTTLDAIAGDTESELRPTFYKELKNYAGK